VVEGQPDKRKIEITVSGAPAAAATLPGGEHLSYLIEVAVEERALSGLPDPRAAHLGWKRSTALQPVVATGSSAAAVLWTGHVLVPAVADKQRRIVIKEFEIFPSNNSAPGQAWFGEAAGSSRRLVFAGQ
jgi:hypothetical protein